MKKMLPLLPLVAALLLAGCASQSKVTLLSAAGFRTVVP